MDGKWLTTAQAMVKVSAETGIPVTARGVDNALRCWAVTDLPQLVNGRRRWRPEDVARLRTQIESRAARDGRGS